MDTLYHNMYIFICTIYTHVTSFMWPPCAPPAPCSLCTSPRYFSLPHCDHHVHLQHSPFLTILHLACHCSMDALYIFMHLYLITLYFIILFYHTSSYIWSWSLICISYSAHSIGHTVLHPGLEHYLSTHFASSGPGHPVLHPVHLHWHSFHQTVPPL